MRDSTRYARDPLTYSSGVDPGEQLITASTTAPTLATHGFVIAGTVTEMGLTRRISAPRYLDILAELINGGASPDDEQLNFSLWFYMPDADSANKWRETAAFVVSGVNKRGAVGADASLDPAGNVYKIDVPRGASRAFVHIATLTTNVHLRVLAYGDS